MTRHIFITVLTLLFSAAVFSQESGSLLQLADSQAVMCSNEIQAKNFPKAKMYCEAALSVYSDKKFSGNSRALEGKAAVLNLIGTICAETPLFSEAKKRYGESLEIYAKLGGFNSERAAVCNNLGLLYDNAGLYEKALECYLSALRFLDGGLERAKTLTKAGNAFRQMSRRDSALKYLQAASEFFSDGRELTDVESVEYSVLCNNLGILYKTDPQCYKNAEIFDKAEEFYAKALKIREKLAEKDSVLYGGLLSPVLYNYGLLYADGGDFETASYYAESALSKSQSPALTADCYDFLGYNALEAGFADEATGFYEKSYELRKNLTPRSKCRTARVLNALGALYYGTGQKGRARECYFEAQKLFSDASDEDFYDLETVALLAENCAGAFECCPEGGVPELKKNAERAMRLLEKYPGSAPADFYYGFLRKISDNLTK